MGISQGRVTICSVTLLYKKHHSVSVCHEEPDSKPNIKKLQKASKCKKTTDIKISEFEIYKTSTIKIKTRANHFPNVKQKV